MNGAEGADGFIHQRLRTRLRGHVGVDVNTSVGRAAAGPHPFLSFLLHHDVVDDHASLVRQQFLHHDLPDGAQPTGNQDHLTLETIRSECHG